MSEGEQERISDWSMPAQRGYLVLNLVLMVLPALYILWELWALHVLGRGLESYNGVLVSGLFLWILVFSGIRYIFNLKPERVAGDAYQNWRESNPLYRWYKGR